MHSVRVRRTFKTIAIMYLTQLGTCIYARPEPHHTALHPFSRYFEPINVCIRRVQVHTQNSDQRFIGDGMSAGRLYSYMLYIYILAMQQFTEAVRSGCWYGRLGGR